MSGEVIISDIDSEKMKKALGWFDRMEAASQKGVCIICGNNRGRYLLTCSEKCHNQLSKEFIKDFGEYKNIVDMTTGKTHRVPITVIFEHGIQQQDLKKYPVVEKGSNA